VSKLVKRIEKEFFLKILYDEQLPVSYHKDRVEYTLFLKAAPKDSLIFKTNRPIDGLAASNRISLVFSYRGDSLLLDVAVMDIREGEIVCNVPESIRKNLDRAHMRVNLPPEVHVHVSFFDDRYALPFPRLRQYHPVMESLATLASLKDKVERLVKSNEYGYKLVIFSKDEFSGTEEQVLANTGRTLFLPEVKAGFPQKDPYNQNRIVTEEVFARYLLESTGVEGRAAETIAMRFIQEKANSGVISEAWVPILFQEYAVGYIRVWMSKMGRPFIDYLTIDTLHKYAEVMAQLLREKGYFEKMRMPDTSFRASVQDISVSGLLFTCPVPDVSLKLMPGCNLKVTITTLRRSLDIKATVTRNYRDKSSTFVGCQFKDMSAEDIGYLFECIYAKPFTEETAAH